jgi:hypothetical protein
LVWRNRKKISQIIKDYFHLPFFLLIILWANYRSKKIGENLSPVNRLRKKGDGWLSWQNAYLSRKAIWVGSNPDRHQSKILNLRHKLRRGQHTLARQKIYKKAKKELRRRTKCQCGRLQTSAL